MSFLFKKNKQPQQQPQEPPWSNVGRQGDQEEDGFVLVGETEDERNALTPDKRDSNNDLPPMYQYAEEGQNYPAPPVYENCDPTAKTSNPSNRPLSQYDNINRGRTQSSTEVQQQHPKTPLHDIPFKIDDSVACALNHGHVNIDIGDEFSWNMTQYSYDFSMERSIIRQSEPF